MHARLGCCSLTVLHSRVFISACLALMHQGNDQSFVNADLADGTQPGESIVDGDQVSAYMLDQAAVVWQSCTPEYSFPLFLPLCIRGMISRLSTQT